MTNNEETCLIDIRGRISVDLFNETLCLKDQRETNVAIKLIPIITDKYGPVLQNCRKPSIQDSTKTRYINFIESLPQQLVVEYTIKQICMMVIYEAGDYPGQSNKLERINGK